MKRKNQQIDQIKQRQAISLLRNKPASVARAVGFSLLTDELHNGWIQEMAFGKEDHTLQAHRGSYKTTCLAVAISIILVLLPRLRVVFIRKTDGDVKEVISSIRKIIESPVMQELTRYIWGQSVYLTKATATEVSTSLIADDDPRGSSQLVGIGIGGSITGKHFDVIFTDDIVNVRDRTSRAERDTTKLFYQELQNIRNRGGRIFNSGTPWHQDDCFSIMPEAERFDCYTTGLLTDADLRELRESMIGSLFSANYELRHIPAEDVIFKDPVLGGDASMVEQSNYCHIDAAYGGEDFTAFTIVRKVNGTYYVLGRLWRKHVDDVESEIIDLRNRYNCGKIYCEDNGDKGYLAKDLRKRGERVVTYHEGMNKFLKITTYLKGEWRNIVFVEGTDREYIQQILDFNEEAEHDDAPDSLASVIRLLWQKKASDTTYMSLLR